MPRLSRRQLLISSAAAAGATFFDLPEVLRQAGAADDEYYGGFPIGIQSYTLRNFDLDQALRHVHGLKLRYIEFYSKHYPTNASPEKHAEMKKRLSEINAEIRAHGVNRFTKNHEQNKQLFEFAKAAGFRNLTADPDPESFESLDKLCEEYNIRICIHNHGPGHRYDKLTNVQKAVAGHHKLIGACIDTGHVLRSNEDPVKWVHELGPRVFGLHLKDVAEKQQRTHDVVIGTAHLDLVGLFKGLKEIKFPADGSISLEYESNPKNPIDDVIQCLAAAKDAIAKV